MRISHELPGSAEPCVLALGNFDGIHLGHRQLLATCRAEAERLGIQAAVLVFDPHPLKILLPERKIKLLTTIEERLKVFSAMGIDRVYLLPFTRQFAEISPAGFASDIIRGRLQAAQVVVGFNYTFGAAGKGQPHDLARFGQEYGFGVRIVPAQIIEGRVVSSTGIRKALLSGDVAWAKKLLGRAPCLCGVVVEGERRGRTIGYPTANLQPPADLLIPKRGVYAVWAELDGKRLHGMMNIGMKPTFHEAYRQTIEIHFLSFQGDLYGRELTVHLEERLRDERKFGSLGELTEQLARDAEQASRILQALPPTDE